LLFFEIFFLTLTFNFTTIRCKNV